MPIATPRTRFWKAINLPQRKCSTCKSQPGAGSARSMKNTVRWSCCWVRPAFEVGSFSLKYADRNSKNTILEGDQSSAKEVFDLQIATGRWFSEVDEEHRSMVVLLGSETTEELFGTEDPLGKEVNVEGQLFTVIGTTKPVKSVFGGGKNPEDNKAYFPLSTLRKLHPELKEHWISIKA